MKGREDKGTKNLSLSFLERNSKSMYGGYQAGEDQMIAGRFYLSEESPSSAGQDGR
jgi:hypothetical protein